MEKEPKPFSGEKAKEIMETEGLEERSRAEQDAYEAGQNKVLKMTHDEFSDEKMKIEFGTFLKERGLANRDDLVGMSVIVNDPYWHNHYGAVGIIKKIDECGRMDVQTGWEEGRGCIHGASFYDFIENNKARIYSEGPLAKKFIFATKEEIEQSDDLRELISYASAENKKH